MLTEKYKRKMCRREKRERERRERERENVYNNIA
jgi:hypothetical protein